MTPFFKLKDPSVVYLFMTVNAEYTMLPGNNPKKRYLPISDANVSLTSSSVNVSAEIRVFRRNTVALGMSLLGQEKNDFNGNKSSNLV